MPQICVYMGRLMISSSQMCISREQEEFLAAYRTDEARQAFIDSYGKEKVNFFDGGYGENRNVDGYPNVSPLYDYEVEYLENTAFTYLDLGVVLFENVYDVFAKFMLTRYVTNGPYVGWFGCFNDEGLYQICVSRRISTNTSLFVYIATHGTASLPIVQSSIGDLYDFSLYHTGLFTVNGRSYQITEMNDFSGGVNSFTVFYNPVNNTYSAGRIYSVRIEKDGVILYDFIPVVSKGKGYMYDKVNQKIFGASGVGDFIIGPRK